jgi:YD repeat-containing protein
VWKFSYTLNGSLSIRTLPSGGTISYTYSGWRVSGITYNNSNTRNVSFTYDANGNRKTMADGAGTVNYTYDALNRLTGITRGSDSFGYVYDPAGNVTSRTYPDATTATFDYDDANRLTSSTSGMSTVSFGYDAAANLSEITLPNGYASSMTYDSAGRLTNVTNANGGSVLSSFDYTLDSVGNPMTISTPSETVTNTYDELDRLTRTCYLPGCSGSGLAGIGYTYDPVGNRLTETRYGTPDATTTYNYDAADQLTSATGPGGSVGYSYANGNETTAGATTYGYDLENRLISVATGGTTETYTYDGLGLRLTRSVNGSLQAKYSWDPNSSLPEMVLERNASNVLAQRFVYGPGLARLDDDGRRELLLPG